MSMQVYEKGGMPIFFQEPPELIGSLSDGVGYTGKCDAIKEKIVSAVEEAIHETNLNDIILKVNR